MSSIRIEIYRNQAATTPKKSMHNMIRTGSPGISASWLRNSRIEYPSSHCTVINLRHGPYRAVKCQESKRFCISAHIFRFPVQNAIDFAHGLINTPNMFAPNVQVIRTTTVCCKIRVPEYRKSAFASMNILRLERKM